MPDGPKRKKPDSGSNETVLKRRSPNFPSIEKGNRHVGSHPERDLSGIHVRHSSGDRKGKFMIEAVTALFAVHSIGVVLAYAFDAYRSR